MVKRIYRKHKNEATPATHDEFESETKSLLERIKRDSSTRTESKIDSHKSNKLKLSIKKKRFYKDKWFLATVILLFVIVLVSLGYLSFIYIYAPAMRIKDAGNRIKATAEIIKADFEKKDITNLEANVQKIREDLDYINSELQKYKFLDDLKLTKGYYENLQITSNIIVKVDNLIKTVLPELKDLLSTTGFRVDPNAPLPVDVEEESSFSLILREMPKYLDLYKSTEPALIDIFAEINKLDPKYIPNVNDLNPEAKLQKFKNFTEEYPETSKQVIEFLAGVPALLGSGGQNSYLLLLQNEAEMRASGGLLTAFGNLTVENGEIGEIKLQDTWNVETYVSYDLGIDTGNRNQYGQLTLMLNGCGAYYQRAQDSGVYPDLYWTLNKFREYYDIAAIYDPINYPAYRDMIIINFAFSEDLLEMLQPLEVEGFGTVTADTLFDFIKADTDNAENAGSAERKLIIEKIANAVKEKLFDLEVDQVESIVSLLVKGFISRDMAITSTDQNIQSYLDKYNMSGRFAQEFDGDYFHLNEAQNCSLKLNKFVRDEVTMDIGITDEGKIHKKVKVEWTQPEIYKESLALQYSPSINFSYRAWVRFFLHPEVSDIESDGLSKSGYLRYAPVEYYDDVLNKKVSDNIVQFDHRRFSEEDPIAGEDMTINYWLPELLNYNQVGRYKLLVQKHPGKSWGEKYTININHKGTNYSVNFILDRDKVITYRDGIIRIDNYNKDLDWLNDLIDDIPFEVLKSKEQNNSSTQPQTNGQTLQ